MPVATTSANMAVKYEKANRKNNITLSESDTEHEEISNNNNNVTAAEDLLPHTPTPPPKIVDEIPKRKAFICEKCSDSEQMLAKCMDPYSEKPCGRAWLVKLFSFITAGVSLGAIFYFHSKGDLNAETEILKVMEHLNKNLQQSSSTM